MRPEDLSRTHWVIIGLLLGLVCSYMRLHIGPPDPSQTHTLANLERALLRSPSHGTDGKDYPWITDILVYPPQPLAADGNAASPPQELVLVTFRVRSAYDQKQWQSTSGAVHLREPINPVNRDSGGTGLTVRAYLDQVGEDTKRGRIYSYAWWAEPKWVYITWTAMSMLIVGGVWPLAQSLLIGAGFGRPSEERRPSLWQQWKAYRQESARRAMMARASSSDSALQKKPQTGSASLTTEEMDRLSAMEAGLQDFLATGRNAPEGEAEAAEAAPAIRPLTAGPSEAPKVEQTKEDKSYGGTFYPTVAHGKIKRPEDGGATKRD